MKLRLAAVTLATLGICFCFTSEASAQRPSYSPPSASASANVFNRPTVSPYLNLLRGGAGGYQSLVRPLVDNGQANRRNAQQIQQLERNAGRTRAGRSSGSQTIAPTGHSTAFRNFSHYYPNLPAGPR